MRCIRCGCSTERACPGGCSWITTNPPKCSACYDQDGRPLYAAGSTDGGLFGEEQCPASPTPALCTPLYTSMQGGHCARCLTPFICEDAA